jgi:hypothetical protein
MANLLVLAGGIVERGAGRPGVVSAYVVLSDGNKSRMFKVRGDADAPAVTELDAATTIDIARFKRELTDDLEPILTELRARGGSPAIAVPKPEWVTGVVERHLQGR